MQSGIYMKTDSQGEVRYLQVKDVNSENKLDYTNNMNRFKNNDDSV